MSMRFACNPSRFAHPLAFEPGGLDGSATAGHGWTRAAWAVGTGDMIALPILEGIDGVAVDLEAVAADRAVVLVYDPDLTGLQRDGIFDRYARARFFIEAADAVLIVVTPHRRGLFVAEADDTSVVIALDANERFARTLGLVSTAPAETASLAAATYVLDTTGAVIWAGVETGQPCKSALPALMPALIALKAGRGQQTVLAS